MTTEATTLADHAGAIRALGAADTGGLLETLRDLRAAVLSADTRALRRSVGFWGRLIGRDIRLEAEARALRHRSGVLLVQAQAQAARLRDQHAVLAGHAARLRQACALLQRDIDAQAAVVAGEAAATPSARLDHLVALRTAYEITASQLDLVAANALAVAERHAQQLPRLAVLLDQQQGVAAGAAQGMQLSSARRTIDELEAYIDHLPAPNTARAPENPAQEVP